VSDSSRVCAADGDAHLGKKEKEPVFRFDNTYARLPEKFYARVASAKVPKPELIKWNAELARQLGAQAESPPDKELAEVFTGQKLLPGSEPIALVYAGHQFGHFVHQLGDGRALLMGEVVDPSGRRHDIQLKGSGRTPFSRSGDGKAPGFSGKKGAGLVGLVAKGDHGVEFDALQGIEMFGGLSGNIDADLGHGLDRPGVDSMWLHAGRININGIALQVSRPAFGHLAAAGIPAAQEKHLQLFGS
jgi:hypothetical protein